MGAQLIRGLEGDILSKNALRIFSDGEIKLLAKEFKEKYRNKTKSIVY